MPNESAGWSPIKPRPNAAYRARQEVNCPSPAGAGWTPGARLQIQRASGGNQGGHICHVHPHPAAIQAEGVIGGIGAGVVDGEGRQMGQIAAAFHPAGPAPADRVG